MQCLCRLIQALPMQLHRKEAASEGGLCLTSKPVTLTSRRQLCAQITVCVDDLVFEDLHCLENRLLVWIAHVHVIGCEIVHSLYSIVKRQQGLAHSSAVISLLNDPDDVVLLFVKRIGDS